VRGVNWIGDAVMTTPALLRLREALPDTHIVLLTHDKLAGLWAGHPAVNEVITFAPKEGVFSIARRLREGSFDTALVLPNSIRTGLEVRLAGIPRRIGYAGSWRNWLLSDAVLWRTDVVKMRKRTVDEKIPGDLQLQIGVSRSRSAPWIAYSPEVVAKLPPRSPTPSPSTKMRGFFAISSPSASRLRECAPPRTS
jgi:hypothetical protein